MNHDPTKEHDTSEGPCACGVWHHPDTQRVIPIESARVRIGRQVARRKVEMAEELLREALPLLSEGPARRLAPDMFMLLNGLMHEFNMTLRQER